MGGGATREISVGSMFSFEDEQRAGRASHYKSNSLDNWQFGKFHLVPKTVFSCYYIINKDM